MQRTACTLVFALVASILLAACGPTAKSGSYLVTVRNMRSLTPVEGATVSLAPPAHAFGPYTETSSATTDARGEAVLLMGAWSSADLQVAFDGDVERYFVNTQRIQRYDHATTNDATEGDPPALRFLSNSADPGRRAYRVQLVRLKEGLR